MATYWIPHGNRRFARHRFGIVIKIFSGGAVGSGEKADREVCKLIFFLIMMKKMWDGKEICKSHKKKEHNSTSHFSHSRG